MATRPRRPTGAQPAAEPPTPVVTHGPLGPPPPRFEVDRNTSRCPNCDWSLSAPQRGRRTGKYFRHCVNPACRATTNADGPPDQATQPPPPLVLTPTVWSGIEEFREVFLTENDTETHANCDQNAIENDAECDHTRASFDEHA